MLAHLRGWVCIYVCACVGVCLFYGRVTLVQNSALRLLTKEKNRLTPFLKLQSVFNLAHTMSTPPVWWLEHHLSSLSAEYSTVTWWRLNLASAALCLCAGLVMWWWICAVMGWGGIWGISGLLGAASDGILFLSETDGFGGLGQDQSDSMHKDMSNSYLKPTNTH